MPFVQLVLEKEKKTIFSDLTQHVAETGLPFKSGSKVKLKEKRLLSSKTLCHLYCKTSDPGSIYNHRANLFFL